MQDSFTIKHFTFTFTESAYQKLILNKFIENMIFAVRYEYQIKMMKMKLKYNVINWVIGARVTEL